MSGIDTPSDSPVARLFRPLPHIPLEILQQIAGHLDLPSALSLSRTCVALRDCGECKIWETIDLTTGWDPEDERAEIFDIPSVEAYQSRAATVDSKLRHAAHALNSYPFRSECVRKIRIEPSDGTKKHPRAQTIMEILMLASNRLKRLDILPLPHPGHFILQAHPEFLHKDLITSLNAIKFPFPNLTHLRYSYEAESQEPLDSWIFRLQNLEDLQYYYSGNSVGLHPSDDVKRQSLPNLRRLTFSHLLEVEAEDDDHTVCILSTLLSLAPNLEFLRIEGEWRPRRKDRLLKEISKLEKLKTVVLTRGPEADAAAYVGGDWEGGIEFQYLGKAEMRFEQAAAQSVMDEPQELGFENLCLPQASNLKYLTILTNPRLPLSEYVSLGMAPTQEKTGHISHFFFAGYIARNPITTLLFSFLETPFPSAYNAHSEEPEYFVEPSRWEEEGYRGAVIRHYITHTEGKEELWHIRLLTRAREHKSGMPYVGARRAWHDLVHYKGRTVPRAVLEEVYDRAGLELASVEAGRDLELGEGSAAWDVLREWRSTAGDESEIEDDFTDDDLADDTDSDEEGEDDDDVSDGGGWGAQILADNVGDDGWVDTDDDGEYDEEDSDDPIGLF